jgi:small-conductance mechanosensitive channel
MEQVEQYLKGLGFDPHQLFYLVIVFFVGFTVLQLIRHRLRTVEKKGTSFIGKLKIFDPVRTKAPFTRSTRTQKENAIHRFEQRFTIIRRTVLIIYVLVWLFVLVFPFIGHISATVVSLIAAILAAVIGIAARPFLENLISGIVITFSRQFRTGDTVLIDGKDYGTVEDITITHSVIKLWDWKRLIIPNGKMLNKELVSYTTKDSYIWASTEFWVAYDSDIDKVRSIAIDVASDSKYLATRERPKFWVMALEKDGIKCWVCAWTKSPTDSWYLKIDVRQKLIKKLQEHGIQPHAYFIHNANDSSNEGQHDDY